MNRLALLSIFLLLVVAVVLSIIFKPFSEKFIPIMPIDLEIPPTLPTEFKGTYISYQKFPYNKICDPEHAYKQVDSVEDCLPGEIFMTNGDVKVCQCSIRNLCTQDAVC